MVDDTIDAGVFRTARPIGFSEVDLDFRLRLPAMLRRFQDAAARHSERVGLGIRRLRAAGRCWVLNRLLLERLGDAEYDEPLAIATWSRGPVGLRMRRDFELSADDRPIGRGTSLWLLLDVAARRPVPVHGLVEQAYGRGARDAVPDALAAWHPQPVPPGAPSCSFTPRDADFDAGRHVNNCVYAEWLLDACRRQHVAPGRVAELRLAFERAIAPDSGSARVDVAVANDRATGQIAAGAAASARFELRLHPGNSEEDHVHER